LRAICDLSIAEITYVQARHALVIAPRNMSGGDTAHACWTAPFIGQHHAANNQIEMPADQTVELPSSSSAAPGVDKVADAKVP